MRAPAAARVAVVGAGTIGMRHITAVSQCPCAILAGVAEKNDRVRATVAETGTVVDSEAGRLIERTNPDGVIVATQTDVHLEAALPAIAAGLPVLIEKPIAATLEQAEAIGNAAAKAGCRVLVGHHRRYHPQAEVARQMVRTGKLGELLLVSGVWGVRKHDGYYGQAFRRTREAGPVMINIVHDIDMLRHVVGEIDLVSALLSHGCGRSPKEDAGVVGMRFASGALGSFALSDRVSSPWSWEYATGENRIVPMIGRNCMRFMGTGSSLDFPNLVHWTYGGGTGDWTKPMSGTKIDCRKIDPFVSQLEHFLDVIEGKSEPLVDVDDATMSLRATLAILKAADSGEWVGVRTRPRQAGSGGGT